MASTARMLVVGIAWITNTLILILMTFANAVVITPLLTTVQSIIPSSDVLNFSGFGYVFGAIYSFVLLCWLVLSWKVYQEVFSEIDYAQEFI